VLAIFVVGYICWRGGQPERDAERAVLSAPEMMGAEVAGGRELRARIGWSGGGRPGRGLLLGFVDLFEEVGECFIDFEGIASSHLVELLNSVVLERGDSGNYLALGILDF
jgi:hypothetical protein